MIDGKDTADYSHTTPALSLHSAEQAKHCFMGKIRPFALLSVQKWDFAGFPIVTAFPLPLSKQKLLLLHCHAVN